MNSYNEIIVDNLDENRRKEKPICFADWIMRLVMKTTNLENGAYTDDRQDKFFKLEEGSWWYKYRIEVFKYIAEKFFDKKKDIADIGGSNGYNTLRMQEKGWNMVLIEPTVSACRNAEMRGVKNVVNKSFEEYEKDIEQWFLLDVIELINDDKKFMLDLYNKTESSGLGLIAAIASMTLWNSEDEVDGHYRRYNIKTMSELVEGAGFEILYINYMYQFLWLPHFILRRMREKLPFVHKVYERTPEEDEKWDHRQFDEPSGIVKIVLSFLEKREIGKIIAGKKIPYGSTIMCVVKKK